MRVFGMFGYWVSKYGTHQPAQAQPTLFRLQNGAFFPKRSMPKIEVKLLYCERESLRNGA